MALPYTADERHALERGAATGRLECPRCGGALDLHDVPHRTEVSYVRDRVWLQCGACGGSAVLDRRRIGRRDRPADPGAG